MDEKVQDPTDMESTTTTTINGAHQSGTPLPGSDPIPVPIPASRSVSDPDPDNDTVDADAKTIYNYHHMNLPLFPSSLKDSGPGATGSTAIFTLCSLDIRVAHYAASLFLSGTTVTNTYSHLIFSGKVGALTEGRFNGRPEAEVFAEIATSPPYNIPADRVIIEPHARNTGENVRYTYALLRRLGLLSSSANGTATGIARFVLVQKPYMERRTYATFVKQWPGPESHNSSSSSSRTGEGEGEMEFTVTSPPIEWEDYPDAENPRDLVISIMVGDLVRIREYPARGYQIEQEIPEEVWQAGQRLIRAGFDRHLP